MYRIAFVVMLCAGLAGCGGVPDVRRSCAELAEARAAERLERDTAILEELEAGSPNRSDLLRQFIRMTAEAYRAEVYEECRQRRGLEAESQ